MIPTASTSPLQRAGWHVHRIGGPRLEALMLATSLAVIFVLVVDQIDGDVAAVEVDGRQVLHVPVSLLPDGVSEGDRLVLRVRRRLQRALRARHARRVLRLGKPPEPRHPPEESRT